MKFPLCIKLLKYFFNTNRKICRYLFSYVFCLNLNIFGFRVWNLSKIGIISFVRNVMYFCIQIFIQNILLRNDYLVFNYKNICLNIKFFQKNIKNIIWVIKIFFNILAKWETKLIFNKDYHTRRTENYCQNSLSLLKNYQYNFL